LAFGESDPEFAMGTIYSFVVVNMALSIDFGLTDELKTALDAVRAEPAKYRALVVVVDKETLTTGSPLMAASANLDADFAQIRQALAGKEAAFVVLSLDNKVTLVTFTPESLKPKMRMIYAASSSHLRQVGKIVGDTHVPTIEEITPALFGHKEGDRVELRTEKESAAAKIGEMLAAEESTEDKRAHAMHGLNSTVSGDVAAAVTAVFKNENYAVVLNVAQGPSTTIILDKRIESKDAGRDLASCVPADEPRFIYSQWEDRHILVYVVPAECKPRVRMAYAASKSSLVSQLRATGCTIDRSLEFSTTEHLEAQIAEALAAPLPEDPQPAAPASKPAMKGPRMFMPE
jgi:hypothetical protein